MVALLQQTLNPTSFELLQTSRQIRDAHRKRLGVWGENIAKSYLKRQGYVIETQNWRSGRIGEVDLILVNHQERMRVFVEVKTRRGLGAGSPLEAVTFSKQGSLYQLAEAYLQQIETQGDAAYSLRMDVVGITFPGENKPAIIEHIQNAF